MKIVSAAFGYNETIPSKYTCDGIDVNPPLQFLDIPENTKCLVLIVEDPDAAGGSWTHWTVWNIDPELKEIDEDEVPEGSVEGTTSFGNVGYGGPCPPDREHRYYFKLYALDNILNLPPGADIDKLENAMEHHVLDEAELMGRYEKK